MGTPRFSESSRPEQLSDRDKGTFWALGSSPVGPSGRDLEVGSLCGVGGPWLYPTPGAGSPPALGLGDGKGRATPPPQQGDESSRPL